MFIEDLVIALGSRSSYINLLSAFSTSTLGVNKSWEDSFVDSIFNHLMAGGTLSTEQARIFIRIARSKISEIAETLRCGETAVAQALNSPVYKRAPYPSTSYPREARFVDGITVALRFKRNATVNAALSRILCLSRPDEVAAKWHRQGKVWLCPVDALSVDDLVAFFLDFEFDVDAETISLCERVKAEPGAPHLSIDEDGLKLRLAPRNALLRWWAEPHCTADDGTTMTLSPSPALARRALALTKLMDLEPTPELEALAAADRLDEGTLAALHGFYRPHDVGVIQKIVDSGYRCVIPTNGLGKVRHNTFAAARLSGASRITIVTSEVAHWEAIARSFGHEPIVGKFAPDAPVLIADPGDRRLDPEAITGRSKDSVLICDVSPRQTPGVPYSIPVYRGSEPYLQHAWNFRRTILLCRGPSMVRALFGDSSAGSSARLRDYVEALHGHVPRALRARNDAQDTLGLALSFQGLTSTHPLDVAPLFDILTDYAI